jgi:hypothetical protein
MNPSVTAILQAARGLRRSMLFPALVVLLFHAGFQRASAADKTTAASKPLPQSSQIDELVAARLTALGIQPEPCSDAVFVRRVFLDLLGTPPTAEEARNFIEDPDKENKRAKLVDSLLRRDEFADYWAMKWGDILRIKAEFPVNLWPNAAQAYHRWVRASVAANKPYDKFARELLTSSGSNFRVGPVNFYRAVQNRTPEGIASAVALTFMGTRTDAWPKERLDGMAVFFSQIGYKPTHEWKEEIVFWDPLRTSKTNGAAESPTNAVPAPVAPLNATFPDGRIFSVPASKDPREAFADWLITPKNPWFTRSLANRIWAWLMGRGVVHEPDDFREDNPPANPELLAFLEKEMAASGYNPKQMIRVVLNSRTYQFAALSGTNAILAETNFGSCVLRRLDAEVLIDAINKITGTSDLYTSAIPEPFTYIPTNMPAVAIADGSITSPFLALFGRSARATGMESERVNRMLPSQCLHLLNSSHIQRKLEQSPKLRSLFESSRKPDEILDELYLTVLSRFPTAEEKRTLQNYGKPSRNGRTKPREDWIDITWALMNSTEFLYRH